MDASRAAGCDSPQEARHLARFGHCLFTDLAWAAGAGPEAAQPSAGALLVAHEVLHALTQRGHPTHEPRGEVMADHWADQGPGIGEDWCDCARRSPYLKPAQAGKGKP